MERLFLKNKRLVVFLLGFAVLFAGAWLRLYDLGERPLDNNESGLMRSNIEEVFSSHEIHRHPPLYHVLHLVPSALSHDPAAIRSLSATFGLLSVLLLMGYLTRRSGWVAGLAAGTFLAFHPLAILSSQTHSTYSMMLFLSLGASIVWLDRNKHRRTGYTYIVWRTLSLLTEYLLVFHWAADAVQAAVMKREKRNRLDFIRLFVPILLVAPLALWAVSQGGGVAVEEYLNGPVRESLSDSLHFLLLFFGGYDWPACLVLAAIVIWTASEWLKDRMFRYLLVLFVFSVLGVFLAALVLQVDERHATLYLGAGAWIVGLVVQMVWRKGKGGKILVAAYMLLFVVSSLTGETLHDRDDRLVVNTWRERLDDVARTLPDDRPILAWPALSFNRILNTIEKGRLRPEGDTKNCPDASDVHCRVRGGQMLIFIPGDRSPEPELTWLQARETFVFLDLYRVFDPGQKLAKYREHPDWPLVDAMAWDFDLSSVLTPLGCRKRPDGVVWDCPKQDQ